MNRECVLRGMHTLSPANAKAMYIHPRKPSCKQLRAALADIMHDHMIDHDLQAGEVLVLTLYTRGLKHASFTARDIKEYSRAIRCHLSLALGQGKEMATDAANGSNISTCIA